MDALQQLRDLHLPVVPGWWPPAPGWWVAAGLICAIVGWCCWQQIRAWQRRKPFRYARAELDRLAAEARTGECSPTRFADQANALLKRLIIHALGRRDLNALAGTPWLRELDAYAGNTAFSNGCGQALGIARFGPVLVIDVDALSDAVGQLVARLERSSGAAVK